MPEFNQSQYWRERHRKLEGDPRSVGNLGRSLEDNVKSEASVIATVERAARLLAPARSVLDLGCGYGRVSQCFTRQGYRYLGIDVSPEAIRQARERNPDAEFAVGDLATWTTERRFDVVLVLYVFVHFVDDTAWRSLLERSLSWLNAGGSLLIADQFPAARENKIQHVVGRPLSDYVAMLGSQGFAFDESFRSKLIGAKGQLLPQARSFQLARSVQSPPPESTGSYRFDF